MNSVWVGPMIEPKNKPPEKDNKEKVRTSPYSIHIEQHKCFICLHEPMKTVRFTSAVTVT